MQEIIDLWKKLGVDHCTMTFDCGGDSMGNTDFELYDKEGNVVNEPAITDYFDNVVYDHVEFYVNSDGHYQGEAGTVEITLNDDGDGFEYSKDATSEYSEEFTGITSVELTPDEVDFVNKFVRTIIGSEETQRVVFKRDCILNDEEVELQDRLVEKINDTAVDFEHPDSDGGSGEWYRFTTDMEDMMDDFESTNLNGGSVVIEGNTLKLAVTKTYYVFKKDND
jgi:hypothetical protein